MKSTDTELNREQPDLAADGPPKVSDYDYDVNIKIVGVGGAGNNTIDGMYASGAFSEVGLIAINTDVQDLQRIEADRKIIIGGSATGGLGAGFHTEIGKRAAVESREEIIAGIQDADLLFVIAGFGGGTGTGATPEIIKIARELEILVMAIVIMPFEFEGQIRRKIAQTGLNEVKELADSYLVVSNDKLIASVDETVTTAEAFRLVNDTLQKHISGIISFLRTRGFINIDFADLQRIIIGRNTEVYLGIGYGSGETAVEDAIRQVSSTPFITTSLDRVSFAIVSLTIGQNVPLSSLYRIQEQVMEFIGRNIDLIIGVRINEEDSEHDIVLQVVGTDSNNSLL